MLLCLTESQFVTTWAFAQDWLLLQFQSKMWGFFGKDILHKLIVWILGIHVF